MRTMAMGWTPRERALLALCVASLGISIAGYLDLGGSAGGAPRGGGLGNSITSGEIRNGTIRSADLGPAIVSADIVDGSIRARDLGIYINRVGAGALVPTTPGATQSLSAACDSGDRVISGGFSNSNPQTVGLVENRFAFPLDAWLVQGTQSSQPQFSSSVFAWALCLNNN